MTTQEGNQQPQENLFKYKKPDTNLVVKPTLPAASWYEEMKKLQNKK